MTAQGSIDAGIEKNTYQDQGQGKNCEIFHVVIRIMG